MPWDRWIGPILILKILQLIYFYQNLPFKWKFHKNKPESLQPFNDYSVRLDSCIIWQSWMCFCVSHRGYLDYYDQKLNSRPIPSSHNPHACLCTNLYSIHYTVTAVWPEGKRCSFSLWPVVKFLSNALCQFVSTSIRYGIHNQYNQLHNHNW